MQQYDAENARLNAITTIRAALLAGFVGLGALGTFWLNSRVYSLEQIAADSSRDRDQATVVEVLSAFVRVHSDPLYQYKASLPETAAELSEPIEEQRRKAAKYVAELSHPPVDVQGAVMVLGRLPPREVN